MNQGSSHPLRASFWNFKRRDFWTKARTQAKRRSRLPQTSTSCSKDCMQKETPSLTFACPTSSRSATMTTNTTITAASTSGTYTFRWNQTRNSWASRWTTIESSRTIFSQPTSLCFRLGTSETIGITQCNVVVPCSWVAWTISCSPQPRAKVQRYATTRTSFPKETGQ